MADKATLYLEDILEEVFQLLQQQDFKQARYLLKKARAYLNEALNLDPKYQPALDNMVILNDLESGRLKTPLGMVRIN